MKENWEEKLSCATVCSKCGEKLDPHDPRILSVYDHQPLCSACKKQEEKYPDYPEVSKRMIGQCMTDTELAMVDPAGYCYHHFYPYRCS